jgi:hypothetical protein
MEAIILFIRPVIWVIAGLIVFAFFYPFLRSVWVRPMMLLWGFYLGTRKAKNVVKVLNAVDQMDNPGTSPEKYSEIVQNAIQDAEGVNKQIHEEHKNHLKDRVGNLEARINKHEQNFMNWRQKTHERFIGKRFDIVDEQLRNIKFKNIVLLVFASIIIYIDALIARHVFVSLGFFTDETLTILGRDIPGGYPMLYGAFLTVALAGFLHATLKIESLQAFFFEQQWGRRIVVMIGLFLLLLLLGAVLFPNAAKELIEIAMRVGWGLGVIIVYWCLTKIIGENESYAEVLIPLALVLTIAGWIVLGVGLVVELFLGKIWDVIANVVLSTNRVRVTKKLENEIIRYQALSQGFRRGFSINF